MYNFFEPLHREILNAAQKKTFFEKLKIYHEKNILAIIQTFDILSIWTKPSFQIFSEKL